MLAKALYDNVAESPDELSFRKGDIMTVLERDTQGLDGWWLCSLHGRQGIVPGNRLKILVGMHDKKPAGPGPGPPAASAQYTAMLPSAYPPQPDSVYLVPTPSKAQQGLYPAPGSSPQFQSPPAKHTSTFSKPTAHHPAPDLYQVPPGPGSPAQDIYQVPPSAGMGHDIYQVPPSMDTRSWEGMKPPAKVRLACWPCLGLCVPQQDTASTLRFVSPSGVRAQDGQGHVRPFPSPVTTGFVSLTR